MMSTGIVRRIDDLGRIVIPREIRRTLQLAEGDAIEILANAETKEIMLRPYGLLDYRSMWEELKQHKDMPLEILKKIEESYK